MKFTVTGKTAEDRLTNFVDQLEKQVMDSFTTVQKKYVLDIHDLAWSVIVNLSYEDSKADVSDFIELFPKADRKQSEEIISAYMKEQEDLYGDEKE